MSKPELATYLNQERLPYPFCPGCGHGRILDSLDQALAALQLDPHQVVLVTDIGCCGVSDQYFVTNALHGLHGRSVTYASGIKLANPALKPIVLVGDGGCGIGGHHLVNAARRNLGVTVLVFNNLNYGMTGGQHSVTTPPGGITSTTLEGNLERPLDICATVAHNGASFVARTTSFDKRLPDLITQAIQNNGFSLIDIWELCTAHYVPNNKYSKKALEATLAELDFATGILRQQSRPEYGQAIRDAHAGKPGKLATSPRPLTPKYSSSLQSRRSLVFAGAAGTRIGFGAASFARGAVLSGLWATQRHDYPITVKTGHSVAEVVLGREEILFPGIEKPDVLMVLFPEGLAKVRSRLDQLNAEDTVLVHTKLLPVDTKARTMALDFSQAGKFANKKPYWATMAIGEMLRHMDLYPLDAFEDALSQRETYAEDSLAALKAGEGAAEPAS
jgi:pyruvate/2-oxoacid:ferredoxin oxidoreductase beta subunit/Pyruvate/2-oxoacid:ferredoxin oxidoreductase gamma subunit